MKLGLVCLGNPTLDFIHSEEGLFKRAGGAAMNSAAAFIQLSGRAGIIGRIGSDRAGMFLLKKIKKLGIDYSRLRIDSKPTFINEIFVKPNDRRILFNKPYYGLNRLTTADIHYLAKSSAVLVGLRSKLFLQCANIALHLSIRLYVSGHFYYGQHHYDLRHYEVAAIIGNKEEINTVKKYCKFKPSTVLVITKDKKGSTAIIDRRRIDVPAFKVSTVDPTGAGGAFAAGYIYADLVGLPVSGRLRYGNACGALTVQDYGAQQKIKGRELEHFLSAINNMKEYV